MDGFYGRFLKIDLTEKRCDIETINDTKSVLRILIDIIIVNQGVISIMDSQSSYRIIEDIIICDLY